MPSVHALLSFALVAFAMAITPGPNMAYMVSRALCQGRRAGYVSLAGVAMGFVVYMLAAALGISALLLAVPLAYDLLRLAGVAYLLWLAWQAVRPGGGSPFEVRALPPDGDGRLLLTGFLTNLLNPKMPVLYLSLLPQFIDPARGHVLAQGVVLGCLQIAVSVSVHLTLITLAGRVALFLADRPVFARVQRWLMATVLGGMALRLAADTRR
ncbi:LysE family translocator [Chitinimonas koreensis]|uniref:LysE family translocator n=1 Tax=Chitinimonas koreensis TaxID=356302 RepID=UPI000403BB8A|nr:LysE family translocator [Chitinimonas koreensis]QNM97295.1 LysE family translocator [Chitinimonas koreensis]